MRESHSSLSTRASVGLSRVVLPLTEEQIDLYLSSAHCSDISRFVLRSAAVPGSFAERQEASLARRMVLCGSTTRERPTDALVDKLEWLSRMPGESPRLSHQGCPTIEPVDLPLPESAQPFRECDKWSGVLPRATRPEMVALPSTR